MATTITALAADEMSKALNAYINSGGGAGKIIIYDATGGAAANASAPIGSNVALATFPLSNPAFTSSGGVLTLDTTPALTVPAAVGGTATHFRILLNNGTTVVLQGSVSATGGGGQLELNTTSLSTGVDVTITAGTVTVPTS